MRKVARWTYIASTDGLMDGLKCAGFEDIAIARNGREISKYTSYFNMLESLTDVCR